MAGAWKTVRVFISSTFRDMNAERDHLVKVVFPALRESLLKDRIYLDDIDLRWGVTREQAENDRVLDLCLRQIDSCRPFFIGILGERYGWVPSDLPPDACQHFGWIRDHPGRSVTELEILHGVLNDPAANERAFFYLRDPAFIRDVPPGRMQEYLECPTERELREHPPEVAEACAADRRKRLRELKERLRASRSGLSVYDNYPCRWDASRSDPVTGQPGRLVGLEAFGESVRQKLEGAIRTDPRLREHFAAPAAGPADPLGLAEEQDYHERFMESRLRVYAGREQVNDALLAFAGGNDPVPCLVTGPSGSGKSAALARFVRDARNRQPRTLVIPHFVGASPRSTNLRDVLRRFCHVLKAHFGFAEEVPEETAGLSVAFREFVGKVPADARVLLVIDALNQLDEADRAQELYWLPAGLPPQVKVVVSCITDSGKPEPALDAFQGRGHHPARLAGLGDAERLLVIRQVPSLSAKTLDDDQVRLLLSNTATANPLFLLVALEELRGFAPYERLNERIAAFPREGDAVTALFTQVIERLCAEFDPELVGRVLTLLASARRGLSERELQELVAGLDRANDLFPVLRQLRPYLLSRAGLIDFYHRNLFKAVRERYLPAEGHRRQAHALLAEYFHAQDYWRESPEGQRNRAKTLPPTPRPANVRKVDELPWQLRQAADWRGCEELLTDLPFLEAKAESGMVFDLVADYSEAVGAAPAEHSLSRVPRLLEEAVRRDIHFIARHPTTLFQCLWNSGWSFGTPAAKPHFRPPPTPAPPPRTFRERLRGWLRAPAAAGGPPPGPEPVPPAGSVREHLEVWRAEKERDTPGFVWVRSHRPPKLGLGGGLRQVMTGYQDWITAAAFSPRHDLVASGTRAGLIRLHDAATGAERAALTGHTSYVWQLAFLPDGRGLLSASWDGTLRLWDLRNGAARHTFADDAAGTALAISGCGTRVVSGGRGGGTRVWDLDSGELVRALPAPPAGVVTLAYEASTGRIVGFCEDGTLAFWDGGGGAEASRLELPWKPVRLAASLSPQGDLLAVHGAGAGLRVWDLARGEERTAFARPVTKGGRVAFSPDGRFLASTQGGDVHLWDVREERHLATLRTHDEGVVGLAVAAGGRQVLTGGYDKRLRVWQLDEARATPEEIVDHPGVTCLAFSADGGKLVSGSEDEKLWEWDIATGLPVKAFPEAPAGITAVAFSPDGRAVVAGTRDATLAVWDVPRGLRRAALAENTPGDRSVYAVAFSADSRRVYSAHGTHGGGSKGHVYELRVWKWGGRRAAKVISRPSVSSDYFRLSVRDGDRRVCLYDNDGVIRVWDARHGMGYGRDVWTSAAALSADEQFFVLGSTFGVVRLYDRRQGQEVSAWDGDCDPITAVAVSPDGGWVAAGTYQGALRVWRVPRPSPAFRRPGRADWARTHSRKIAGLTFSPDRPELAVLSADGQLALCRLGDRVSYREVRRPGPDAGAAAVSSDGRRLAFVAGRGKPLVTDLDSRAEKELQTDLIPNESASTLAFSPDGEHLLIGHDFGTFLLYNLTRGTCSRVRKTEGGWLQGTPVAFDGRLAAFGGANGDIALWGTGGASDRPHLRGHTGQVIYLRLVGGGGQLLSVSHDETARLWDLESGRCLESVRLRPGAPDLPPNRVIAGRWRVVTEGEDSAVVPVAGGPPVAWFPARFDLVEALPSRAHFAASTRAHLHILSLEGAPPE